MPPYAKAPVTHRSLLNTDTSVMALSAVFDTAAVLDQAKKRVVLPRQKKKRNKIKMKRGLRK